MNAVVALTAFAVLTATVTGQPLARHALPVSKWRKNSRNYLQAGDAKPFAQSGCTGDADSLLCEVGSVISAGLPGRLPRKELFEAHAVSDVVNRYFPSQVHVLEPCAGCGLLAVFLVLSNRRRKVRCSDKKQPRISHQLMACLTQTWPFLQDQIQWEEADVRKTSLTVEEEELLVSCHACSLLSDEMILAATRASRPMVLVPCCYDKEPSLPERPWLPNWHWRRWPWLREGAVNRLGQEGIHQARVACLEEAGYHVEMDEIDSEISDMYRVIVAQPEQLRT